jgi:hypothetical protein
MSADEQHLKGPHFVVTAAGDIHGDDTRENREIVRRIHACVSACEGISTEELEKGIVADMRRVIAQVVPLLQERNTETRGAARQPVVVNARPVSETTAR